MMKKKNSVTRCRDLDGFLKKCGMKCGGEPSECIDSSDRDGSSYRGTVARTKSGRVCQRWDVQSPNKHKQTPEEKPYAGLEENYCRNPDGSEWVWCYSGEGRDPRWEYCDIPTCSKEKDCIAENDKDGS